MQDILFFILFPAIFILGILLLIISSTLVARCFLFFANLVHKPREGIFFRNKSDKDYCYWSLRAVIRKWPTWVARQLSLPFLELLVAKILGLKTSYSSCLNEGWVDCEFIECGKNVKLGQGSIIMSNILIKDKIILKKVSIGDNVIIGAHSVILPGTVIGSNTIIDSITLTTLNQELDSNSLYSGQPARKVGSAQIDFEKKEVETKIFETKEVDTYDPENLRTHEKEMTIPFQKYITSGFFIIGASFIVPGFIFILYFYGFLIPSVFSLKFSFDLLLNSKILIYVLLTPIIFIGIYLLHLFFVALFTRWFYRYVDKRGPSQGVFDRNLDQSTRALDYYHFRSFLLKYPVFAFIRSPFPWLINWELKFIGSNKIGKGTIIEECYLHGHIDYGKDCYVGTFSHISNHLVDGVYGSENLTYWGAKTGDKSVYNAMIGGMPGLEVGENTTLLPQCTTIKFDKLGDNGIYGGFPAKKLNAEEIKKITGGEYHDD